MSKLVIDRQKWDRGRSPSLDQPIALLSDSGMCCLGFFALSCGYTEEEITDIAAPSDLNNPSRIPDWMIYKNEIFDTWEDSISCQNLMGINDDTKITDTKREELIRMEFAKNDVEVEFIN